MPKAISAKTLIAKHVSKKDRVLLLNPPVEETRYSWRRWNQPVDLLKIGSFLRHEIGCRVELLDMMCPDAKGEVKADPLPRDRRYYTLAGHRYPMRRFGEAYATLDKYLTAATKQKRDRPTQIWITSLCSYWYEGVAEVCRISRKAFDDVQIVLLGQYPALMTEHACDFSLADYVVTKKLDLSNELSDIDLYGNKLPPFIAVNLEPAVAIQDVRNAAAKGIFDVAIFSDDVCADGGEPLAEIIRQTEGIHRHIRYHLLCGLHPGTVSPAIAKSLANKRVLELYFEEEDAEDGRLKLEAYSAATSYLREAGLAAASDRLGGFAWIGRPNESLEQIIQRSFGVLEMLGSVILKPFTPVPGSPEHKAHSQYLENIGYREWSPHFFPFAELNGITRDEYHDLYRMAAFLNEKIRNQSFDFLKGSIGAAMLQDSLKREVWTLEPHPLRVTD